MIGVFVAELGDAYQQSIWQGIVSRATELNTGVICFSGRRLDPPDPSERASNAAFGLADRCTIQGVVVLSSAIGTFQSMESLRSVLRGLDLPVVSVGLEIQGLPSVTVRGRHAMADHMRHLIVDHGARNFALIAGPKGHREAEERERVFREALIAHDLVLDEALVIRGNFLAESGTQAARDLLERGLEFDTLVCMNDRMAMAAMAVLREAGLRIPADIRVSGFDDIAEARWETPPLTTVNQPLENLGRSSIDMLFELFNQGNTANRELFCSFVPRESCGCLPGKHYKGVFPVEDADRPLLLALEAYLASEDESGFLGRLNTYLVEERSTRTGPKSQAHFARWHHYLQAMDGERRLLDEAQALVSNVEIRDQVASRLKDEAQHLLIRNLSARLAGSFGMGPMVQRLAEGLETLGIKRAFLATFTEDPRQVRLILAHCLQGEDGLSSCTPGLPFDVAGLLPPEYRPCLEGRVWILEPLVFQDEVLGYLLIETDERHPSVYENLRDQVSSSLKGTLLMEHITLHEQDLENQVFRRTDELKNANHELTELISRRRILERQVQDISERTMESIGQDLHDDLCQHLAGIGMFAAILEGQLKQAEPDPQAVNQSLGTVRQLLEDAVTRTRQIARGLFPPGLAEQGLVATLEDLVESMNRGGKVQVTIEAAEDFRSFPAPHLVQLFRILQESLHNAVRHSGSDLVMLRLFRQDGFAVAEVRDFGTGIKHHGGSGMGLSIMKYRAESIGAELAIEQLNPGVCIACRMALHG